MTDTANAPERIWTADTTGNCSVGFNTPSLGYKNEYISRTHCDELVAAAYVAASGTAWTIAAETELHAIPYAALTAYGERMKAEGAKEERKKWQKSVRDTFDAMCAMRNAINEHVPMPSLESDLLHGPENSVFCAAVAESVTESQKKAQAKIARLTEALNEKQDDGKNFWMKWTQKRLEINRAMFLRDAKLALAGDMRALRNRVELMEAEPVPLVLSSALQENPNAEGGAA